MNRTRNSYDGFGGGGRGEGEVHIRFAHFGIYYMTLTIAHPKKTLRINSDKHTKQEKQSRG